MISMRVRRLLHGGCVRVIAFALLFAFVPGQAQSDPTATFTEWATPTPNSGPLHIIPSGNLFFFTERSASKIGRVNPTINAIREWALPADSAPHDIVLASSGAVFFCEQNGNIAMLNPGTNVLTQWPTPTAGAVPLHLGISGSTIFFTEDVNGSSDIGMLNTSTNQFTEWAIPTTTFSNGIFLSPQGLVFFVENTANKVGRLNPANNTFTEWSVPGAVSLAHVKFAAGFAWVDDSGSNTLPGSSSLIARLDTVHNVIAEFFTPTTNSDPGDLSLSPAPTNLVNFTESAGNNIGVLNPAVQAPASTFTVSPVVTTVTPVVSAVTPTTTTLAVTVNKVTPTVTTVTGVVSGGFTEFAIPTASSFPVGIKLVLTTGALAFAEEDASKVATLTISTAK